MRFSIRDLLWLTVVVAMGLGWWSDNRTKHAAVQQAQRQRIVLKEAKRFSDDVSQMIRNPGLEWMGPVRNWSVLDEPLVEP
jgi:hypothetical protein